MGVATVIVTLPVVLPVVQLFASLIIIFELLKVVTGEVAG